MLLFFTLELLFITFDFLQDLNFSRGVLKQSPNILCRILLNLADFFHKQDARRQGMTRTRI